MKQIDLIEAREQMQEEIICFIDSYGFISHPEFIKDNACQIVVESFNDLIDKYLEAKCAGDK
ncbi:hypothetical protein CMI37_03920 [Candidatus Pacearchaeota archaeon]|nr:hypothetical protein [Candidatus Pacearchaeota archaeon]|tara:strand:- start:513 stop:698 length:186 start_codon:yes stop_codon:yes gene_type:complete